MTYPPRPLFEPSNLQPSDPRLAICPIISKGAPVACLGAKCAAWTPASDPSIGFCKIIEQGGAK